MVGWLSQILLNRSFLRLLFAVLEKEKRSGWRWDPNPTRRTSQWVKGYLFSKPASLCSLASWQFSSRSAPSIRIFRENISRERRQWKDNCVPEKQRKRWVMVFGYTWQQEWRTKQYASLPLSLELLKKDDFHWFSRKRDGRTDGRTNQRTDGWTNPHKAMRGRIIDGPMDWRTDTPSYRDATAHLKSHFAKP